MKLIGITKKKRKGFMLLELIIVIAIIGVLAAIAIPNFIGMTDEAKSARIQADLSTIGSAVEVYYVKHGTYPSSLEALVSKDGKEGYLRSLPEPPDKEATYSLNSSNGEVTSTFNGQTYSSFGTKK